MAGARNPWEENYGSNDGQDTGAKPWEQAYQQPEAPKSRTLGAVANDTVIEVANAAAGGVSAAANFVKPGNAVSGWIDKNIVKAGEDSQSDVTKAAKQQFRDEVENADGVMGELGAVGKYVVQNPLLSAAQAAGSFVGPGLAVKAAGFAGKAAQLGAKGVERAGRAGGVAAGAAMAGGDAAGTAYELSKNAGATEDQAVDAGRQASVIPAIVGGVSGMFGAERLLAGAKGFSGGVASRALKTGASEAAQEGLEEGVTQYEGQRAAMPYDASIDPSKGVAAAAGMGAALGGITGAGTSLLAGHGPQPGGQEPAPAPGQPPAAAPANPGTERIQQEFAAQLSALQQQEQGDPTVPQTAPPDGAAALAQQRAQAEAQRQAAIDASRAVQSPDDEIYQSTGMQASQDVTRNEKAAPDAPIDPVREQVAAAAEQGGALSGAALTAIDTGVTQAMQPAPEQAPPQISLEEADARDQAAYEQFFANHDAEPVVSRYYENDDDIPDFGAASNVRDEEFLRSLGATDEDIQDAIATARQSPIPQSSPAVDAGAQANEPAGPREGAGGNQAAQGQGQVTLRQPENFTGAPSATMGKQGATARPGPAFGLKDALAQIRAKKQQEAANAQAATPEAAPAAQAVPAAGTGSVEAAGVEPAKAPTNRTEYVAEVRRQLGDLQPGDVLENDMGDKWTVDVVMRNKAGEVTGFLPREINPETGEREVLDLDAAGSVLLPSPYLDASGNRKLSQPGKVNRAQPATLPAQSQPNGAPNVPQADQAIQASPQPAQAAAAPAAEPATSTGAPATAGASTVRALSDAPTPQNIGAQAAPAAGQKTQEIDNAQSSTAKALIRLAGMKGSRLIADDGRGRKLFEVKVTPEFRNRHFVNGRMPMVDGLELKEKSSVTGNAYDDGYILIDNREQLAARRAATAGAQSTAAAGAQAAPAETKEQRTQRVAAAGEAWTRMPTVEREAMAGRADGLNPMQRKSVQRAAWADLSADIQRKLADAMAPVQANAGYAPTSPASLPPPVAEMVNAFSESLAALRGRISDVTLGDIENGRETITFKLDGAPHKGVLTGRNRDLVVAGDGRESDKSIAVSVLLDKQAMAQQVAKSEPTPAETAPTKVGQIEPSPAAAAQQPAQQPITRADVTAAQQQAAAIITERIDAMTAGEVNTIARRFLPTMGVRPTVSKERNKAAVTDFTKVNPMAAADEFGATLPADVRRALQADMEGTVEDGFVEEVNPFAEYDAVAKQYGYEVRPDGMIGSDGKFPGPKMAVQRGRLRVESGAGNLLGSYAATPESIGKFLEAFWYAEKKAVRGSAPAQQEAKNPARAVADGFVEQGGLKFSRAKGKPNKDSEYLAAVESSDMETAQRMVDQAARDAGYISGNDYRMAHSAPSSEMDTSLVSLREEGLVPADYWTKPQWYQSTPEEMDSWRKVTDAFRRLDAKTKPGGAPYPVAMTVYRAVPKDVKDGSIRNGDWVTPSLEYAKMEGESIPGGYRVISQQALIRNLYWDGNSIAELGYDDGKGYAYKNTKNNRKLMDAVTRDDDGNIIPLSQRFNAHNNDVRFSFAGARAATADKHALVTAQNRIAAGVAAKTQIRNMDKIAIEKAGDGGSLAFRVTQDGKYLGRFASVDAAQEFVAAEKRKMMGLVKTANDNSAEAVRRETGWFQGKDGKWRFEINDADAKLRPALKSLEGGGYDAKQIASVTYRKREDGTYDVTLNPPSPKQTSDFVTLTGISKGAMRAVLPDSVVASVDRNEGDDDLIGDFEEAKRINVPFEFGGFNALPLDNVIDHPALFAAYPALRDVMVQVDPKLGIGGSFSYVDHNDGTTSKVIRLGSARQLSTLLHEIQHGIQDIEGFASGGSPNDFRDESADAEMLRDGAILAVMMRSQGTIEKAKALFVQRFKREPAFGSESAALSGESPESMRARADNALAPQERYRRLAGEVEARNTQARQGMTDEQRRATPPSQTADVADSRVIVMFNGKEMANAPMPANAAPDAAATAQPLRTPAATIRAAITKAYGKLLGQLESKGLVTLTQTEDEAIEAAAQARAAKTGQSVEQARASLMASVKNSVADQTQTDAFKRWFKGSKVVDADGKPLVVYHGTPKVGHTVFDVSNVGVFFSDRFDVAASYAGRYNEVEFDEEGAYTEDGTDQGVYAAYLAIAKPKVIDWGGKDWGTGPDGLKLDEWANRARRAGHDGLIVESVADTGWLAPGMVADDGVGRVFVAFRPAQIKSATGNNGDFDPTNPDIRRSADGAIQGFFDPQTGQSFLIADNLTAEAAPGVLMHEVGIHMAADGSMKALFNRAAMMLKLQRGNPFMKAVQDRMDAAGETSGEEAAAYIAEAYENDRANAPASVQRWLADLLAAVKAWMFKKGIMGADRLTVADIAAVARANARSMARDGGATGGQGFGTAFSRAPAGDQTQTDAFKRWFKGSKVVDAEGKPLVVYHGTRRPFNEFSPSRPRGAPGNQEGIYFTADKGVAEEYAQDTDGAWDEKSRIVSAYIKIENDLDGKIIDSAYRGREYVVFKPENIKSATGNNGNFDPANPDIRFSRTTEAAKAAGDAIKSVTVTNIKQKAGFKLTDYLGVGLQALGRRQIVDIYGDMLPLAEYNRLVQQMEADKNEGGAEADQLVTRWAKLPDDAKLADLMHDATLAQIDPAKPYVDGDDKARYMTLQGRFNALSAEAKQVYTDTRDSYHAHHAKVRSAIKERIERSEIKGERKAALLKQMDDEFFKAIKGVYFPLARFGQYAVTVKGPDGKVESVSRAETKAEAEALRNNLLAAFPRDKGFIVGRVMLSKDFIADRDAVGRGFMTELYQVLDKQNMDAAQRAELEDTLGQLYLSSLPDLSWAKHGIHRKGTPGFSQDARRAYAQNMFHGARYLAKLRYSDLMQDELAAMQKHVDDWREVEDFDQNSAQRVVDEMNKRHESLMNPKSNALSTALTSLGFVFHLGLSPASAMVNLSQTALVAYPIMGAKWGFNKASAALLNASKQAASGKNDITGSLNADERAAYDEAVRAGTIDVTMAHDLAGIAQGEDAGVMWKIRPVMRWASFLFHHAERFNRQVTFVAAYRLAREAGADHKAAFEQATKATYDGHFDYGAANRPRIMQGNVAKVLLLFKQYGQNMVYTLSRNAYQSIKGNDAEKAEARKALAGLLTSHAMAAGVLGLPMVTTLLAAASMIGGDDDEPWDAKVALQNMLADAFGQKPAEVLAHGLSRLTPWDISGRVGLDRLIFPDVQEGLEGQRLAESAMAAALGPVAGIGVNLLKGMQMMGEGRYAMGLEAIMPAALRGPVKALRYAEEGVQDKSGISILDEVSPAAVAGQALGFSPSAARNAQDGKSAILAHDRALGERRQELLTKIARATMAKDEEAKAEAREEIRRFNEKNPGRRINPNHIMASVRGRQKRIDQAQDGVYLPRNRRDAMDVGRFALGD